MARVKLTVKKIARTQSGSEITFTDADGTNDHSFDNSTEESILVLRNLHTEAHEVTIKRPVKVDGTPLGDVTINVPANGGVVIIGPFPAKWYSQADAGNSLNQAVLVDCPADPTDLGLAVVTFEA